MELFNFIRKCPTPFHTVDTVGKVLLENGFTELSEGKKWRLDNGKSYYVTRNMSSLIAFSIPQDGIGSFMITASHSDSPTFKIKENASISDGHFVRLSTEKYGGMIYSTWLDRPLGIAGRVIVRTENGIEARLYDSGKACAIIPNVAIHMNPKINCGAEYNPSVDLLPVYSAEKDASFKRDIAEALDIDADDILSTELSLYNADSPVSFGNMICAPRLDDLQCAFASLVGFLKSKNSASTAVYCLFDNEEVGSKTKQGAGSTFLEDVISRICECFDYDTEDRVRTISNSFLLSCDNAHSVHPNHPEYADKNHSVYINGGVVIKYNANQFYTSDAISSAIFKTVCEKADVPYQLYANRADMAGGSTLGNILNTKVSLNSVDIGLAQLAMHSAMESAGLLDTEYMIRATERFFSSTVIMKADGVFEVKKSQIKKKFTFFH